MGCMAQSRGAELIDRLPDVDLVIGTQKFHRAGEYLDEIISGKRQKIVDVEEESGSESTIREHLLNGTATKSVTAYVSIMQGLQPILHLLHRALHPRRGTQPLNC
jgi:2-methylthioadenine synthetase